MENKRKSITEIKAEFSNADVNAVKQVIENMQRMTVRV